jgi:putative oxidoreductase
MSASTSTVYTRSQVTGTSSAGTVALVLFGRFLFVLIFLMSGPMHFTHQTIAFAAAQGVPLASIAVPFSGVLALAGGLSILLGYRAKIGAWLLVLFLAGVTPMLHNFWAVSDPLMHQMQFVMFMKNLSMMGAALFFAQAGTGTWSLDARRK